MLSNVQASSAYWRGNKDRESLQRVYGISYPDQKRLKVILCYLVLGSFFLLQLNLCLTSFCLVKLINIYSWFVWTVFSNSFWFYDKLIKFVWKALLFSVRSISLLTSENTRKCSFSGILEINRK